MKRQYKKLSLLGLVMTLWVVSLFALFPCGMLFAQAPDTLWTRTYGGIDDEYGWSVQQTSDGGYIITGGTKSFGAGGEDVYLIKTDANGDTLWTRAYGGTDSDAGTSVQQTSDGGYIIAGTTKSFGAGSDDIYLIKTDANGDTLWTRTYGGADRDVGYSAQQTPDGGYIIAGSTKSLGVGEGDVYLIKTDANGDTLWTRAYGGTDSDAGTSVQQTSDGGYIIAGTTKSFGAGERDVYLIKTTANGDTLWTRTYGGLSHDYGHSVQQTSDGSYIVAGQTYSFGAGEWDVYLVKTDTNGDTLWTKTYGGTDSDYGYSVQQTSDGSYIVAGWTGSFGAGETDVYLIKTNANGDTLWTKTYGGTDSDYGYSVQQTSDGGYIIVGYTGLFGAGGADLYLIKTKPIVVVFNDPNLEQVVRDALGIPTGDIYDTDMATLTSLDASSSNISDLTGLEYAVNLTYLYLSYNQISDITALQNLTNLNNLDLSDNQISDITLLQNLTNLNTLWIQNNQVDDISALQNLTNLYLLGLHGNNITNIGALQNLTNLTYLSLHNNQIADITALQNLTSLTELYLHGNEISDITALQYLTSLTRLQLTYNQINDITALQNLTALTFLHLAYNQIVNITALQNLTSLTDLFLYANKIRDITVLQNLTNLTYLELSSNQISNIAPLQNLTALTTLELSNNQINDLTALHNVTSLTSLYLNNNQLDNEDLQNLYALDNLTWLDIRWNSGIISGTAVQTLGDNLDQMNCEDINWDGTCGVDPNIAVICWVSPPDSAGLGQTVTVQATATDSGQAQVQMKIDWGDGNVSDYSELKDNGSTFEFTHSYSDTGNYDIKVIAKNEHGAETNWSVSRTITIIGEMVVHFNDPNLEQAVRDALGIPTGDITAADMATLTSLTAQSDSISDLTGLEYAVNLDTLNLIYNQISDVTSLQYLTSLTYLNLNHNQISDLTPLQYLTNLTKLYLNYNQISDITPLQYLTSLPFLNIGYNQISDITALQNMTSLTQLYLRDIEVSDISPLQNLTNLTHLALNENQVSDIAPLQNLTDLNWLDVRLNQIADITALQNLTSLTSLYLYTNLLDNEALADLYNLDSLTVLNLTGNPGIISGTAMQTLGNNLDSMDCEDILWDGTCGIDPDTAVICWVSPSDSANVEDTVTVQATATDSSQAQVQMKIDWGDGNVSDYSELKDNASTFEFTHSYPDTGNYDIKVIAKNEHGVETNWSVSRTITVGGLPTAVGGEVAQIYEYSLCQNYPNPFNNSTVIKYSIKQSTHVEIIVYDISGRLVKSLISQEQQPGEYNVVWDGTDSNGHKMASGLYFYRLRVDNQIITNKMLLMQ
jgi:Leucine-rich repeat (LRR) protein